MTNPQHTQNLLAVIRSLPPADGRWLLEQLEQGAELNTSNQCDRAMTGGAFDDLADEPDLYTFSDGEPVSVG